MRPLPGALSLSGCTALGIGAVPRSGRMASPDRDASDQAHSDRSADPSTPDPTDPSSGGQSRTHVRVKSPTSPSRGVATRSRDVPDSTNGVMATDTPGAAPPATPSVPD